jgi:hypothetical protein
MCRWAMWPNSCAATTSISRFVKRPSKNVSQRKMREEGPIPVAIAFTAVVSSLAVSMRTGVLPTPSSRASSGMRALSSVWCGARVPIVSRYGSTSTSTAPSATNNGAAASHQRRRSRPASSSRIVSAMVNPTTWPSSPGHWLSAHSR